jgi:integrase
MSRPFVLKVRDCADPNTPFVVDYRAGGKRKREFFKTKVEAKTALDRIKYIMAKEGQDGLLLPNAVRAQAVEANKLLAGFPGKTIVDAVRFYVSHLEAKKRSVPVRKLVDEYLATKQRKGVSAVHQSDLESRYGLFCATFGDEPTRTLTGAKIQDWLDARGLEPASANNYRSRLSSLFKFGISKGYLDVNPCGGIERITVPDKPIEIYTVDEMAAVLEHASPELLPALVIGAYTGIRTQERIRLTWGDIDIKRGFVTVPKAKSKTARRVIKMEPCLQAWLVPLAGRTGPIFHGDVHDFVRQMNRTCKLAGLAKAPKNGLRHSYASYHAAKYNDAELLRNNMGHTTARLLFTNYRELVHPEQAERYFNLFPPTPATNVVAMAS